MTITKHKVIFGAFLAFLSAFFMMGNSYATDITQYLQISPTQGEIELSRGETYHGEVTVSNIGADSIDYKMEASPFFPVNQEYNLDFEYQSDATRIAEWVEFGSYSGSLDPGERERVSFVINVPNDAPSGGQYMAILAVNDGGNDDASDNSATVRVIGRTATLFFAKVAGETVECSKIISNTIPMLLFAPPITANSVVEDCGNVHLNANYSLRVFPLFSDEEIYPRKASEESTTLTIVPGTSRYFSNTWTEEDGAPSFGIFNVEQTIEITGSEPSTVRQLVIVIPLWLLIILILFIGAVVFWLVSRSRQRKESRKERA